MKEDVPQKVKWVERYTVGITHPSKFLTQDEIDQQMSRVNDALRFGDLIAVEQNFTVLKDPATNGEILTQYIVYHIGFRYRPPGK